MGACLDKGIDCLNQKLGTHLNKDDIIHAVDDVAFHVPDADKKRVLVVVGSPGYEVSPIVNYIKQTFIYNELSVAEKIPGTLAQSLKHSSQLLTEQCSEITYAFKFILKGLNEQKIVINNFPKTMDQLTHYNKDCGGLSKIVGVIFVNWGDETKWKNRLIQHEYLSEEQANSAISHFKNDTAKFFESFKLEERFCQVDVENDFDQNAKEQIDKIMRAKKWDL